MSFRNRLRLFFTLIVVVPMIAIGAVLFSLTTDSERGKADAGLATGQRTAISFYSEARGEARDEVRTIGRDPELNRALAAGDRPAARKRLRELLRASPELVSAEFFDQSGGLVARAGSERGVAPGFAELSHQGATGRLGTLTVSVVEADELLLRAKQATGLDFALLRGGRTVDSTIDGVGEIPLGSSDIDHDGIEYRVRRARIADTGGVPEELAVFQEAGDINSAIADSRLLIGVILLAFGVLALASSVYVGRALQNEIGGFLEAARRLAGGRFDKPVPTRGHDEFAQLGNEFNSMSAQLEAKIEEVQRKRDELEETIRRVGQAFATGLDQQGIFELTVQTAVDACDADCGRALPLDLRVLTETLAGNHDPDLVGALEVAERDAFEIGEHTGRELLEGADPSAARPVQHPPTAVEASGIFALALPLRARLGTRSYVQDVGVLSIARREREFTREERELLEYLGGQAVVSIENADLHETVQRQAVTDELTGLANVREMHGILDRELERRRRFETPLGLVLIDIDDFKLINDTYGHQQGDDVLAEVAAVLRDQSRDIDSPARYGGEEMAVVLPQTDVAGAVLLASRMREAIERLRVGRLDGRGEIRITASFGVAAVPDSASDKGSLIAAADNALYRAKRAGKNRVERADAVAAAQR